MSLSMVRPSPHPTSRVYRIRQVIPPRLRALAAQRFGQRTEFIESLGTKDPAEALRCAPKVIEKFAGWIAALEAESSGVQTRLSEVQVSALCGRWLADQLAAAEQDLGGTAEGYDLLASDLGDALRDADETGQTPDTSAVATDVDALLRDNGLVVDAESHGRLAARLLHTKWAWARDMAHRAQTGQWRSTVTPEAFAGAPTAPPEAAADTALTPCRFADLLAGFAGDKGWAEKDRNRYDRERTLARLQAFLGHDDALRVSKANVVAWKADMQARGISIKTQRNDISEMSAIWRWGGRNGKLTGDNPFAGVSPPKPTRQSSRDAFTNEQARHMLLAAKGETGALQWLPWLLCFTGARIGELAQAVRDDVTTVDGITVLRIHDDAPGMSVKNAASRRVVPLHPAVIAEGFLNFVKTRPPGAALFSDLEPDSFGRRSSPASKLLGRWMRAQGITSPRLGAAHSWRHRFVDEARRVQMHPEVQDAILGHANRRNESAGYGAGMGAQVRVLAEALATIPSPLSHGAI